MNFLEGLRIALWSLWANPLRSFLTLLGIIIGVTAIISVVAIINGLNLYVEEKMITLGPGCFEVGRFGIITSREEFLKAIRRNPELRLSDATAVREHCTRASLVGVKTYGEADLRRGNKILRAVRLKGISHEIMLMESYEVQSGRAIGEEDVEHATTTAFISADVAEELFGPVEPVGKAIKLEGRSFTVVGVGAPRGSVFGQSRDNYVLMPVTTFHKIFGSRDSLGIVVRTRDALDIEQGMDEVRTVLRARHHLRYDEEDDFGIVNAEGLQTLWKRMSRTIFQIALFVVGISLVVGGIVIMNIMLVAVIERTREIGLRKAIGARRRDIRRQFLLESIVLAAAGGCIGVLAALAVTLAVRYLTPMPAVFPWWAPALALSISSAVGIFFGLYPASKASLLNPIEALRSE